MLFLYFVHYANMHGWLQDVAYPKFRNTNQLQLFVNDPHLERNNWKKVFRKKQVAFTNSTVFILDFYQTCSVS